MPHDSVYAITTNVAGTLVATGSTDVRRITLGWLLVLCSERTAGWGVRSAPARSPHHTSPSSLPAHAQSAVSVVDVRSGQVVMRLKGHTDNVRALQLDREGRLLLSGSSDHTVRLWDLGQQRCVQTLAIHTDSVWALAASSSFATVYSGGRDGCIYRCGGAGWSGGREGCWSMPRHAWRPAHAGQPPPSGPV